MPSIFNGSLGQSPAPAAILPPPASFSYSRLILLASSTTITPSGNWIQWSSPAGETGWWSSGAPERIVPSTLGIYRFSACISTGTWTGTLNNLKVVMYRDDAVFASARTLSTDGYGFNLQVFSYPTQVGPTNYIRIFAECSVSSLALEAPVWFVAERLA